MTTPDSSPIGLAGRITTATRGEAGPGEVEVRIRAVIVVQTLGPRTVIVLPWADPVDSLLEL
jgi:hypothetical protein